MSVPKAQRVAPVWLAGCCNLTQGAVTGIAFFVLPQLLAAEHVSEARIAMMSAAAWSPNFWAVLLSPMLDVRFSRRRYATAFAALSACGVTASLLIHRDLLLLQFAVVLAVAASALFGGALGGWLSIVTEEKNRNALSTWLNVALIGGTGASALLGGEMVRHLPLVPAASLLGLLVLLPVAIFPLIHSPGPDGRLARESFSRFQREIWALLRRREVVIVLLLFLSPCSSFALTNLLGGLGNDFHASARAVSIAGGVGAVIPGLIGCFLFPVIARRVPLRLFYLANGAVGSLFTLSVVFLPHRPWTFGAAVFAEFLFQAVAFAVQIGIVFDVIGPDNPLAATTFSVLTAVTNIPVTLMIAVDGRAYAHAGVSSTFATDAVISILTCVAAAVLLARFDSRGAARGAAETPGPVLQQAPGAP